MDDSGSSPLYIATAHGHGEIVDLLISRGADLNRMNKTRYTPLLTALQNSHYKIAKKLILAGTNVNINKQMPYGFDVSLLNVVLFEKQQWDICKMLIKAGTTPVKFTSPIGYILLEDSGLQLDTAKLLIAAGFNIYVEHWVDQMKKRDQEDITETQVAPLTMPTSSTIVSQKYTLGQSPSQKERDYMCMPGHVMSIFPRTLNISVCF